MPTRADAAKAPRWEDLRIDIPTMAEKTRLKDKSNSNHHHFNNDHGSNPSYDGSAGNSNIIESSPTKTTMTMTSIHNGN